jgi:hypothetical protein
MRRVSGFTATPERATIRATRGLQGPGEFPGPDEPTPLVRTARQQPEDVLGPNDTRNVGGNGPVQRREHQKTARADLREAFPQEGLRVDHVLDHLHVQHHVETVLGEVLQRHVPVGDGEPAALGMFPGNDDIARRHVDAEHLRPVPRHALRQDAAAAADVQHPQALQRLGASGSRPSSRATCSTIQPVRTRFSTCRGQNGPDSSHQVAASRWYRATSSGSTLAAWMDRVSDMPYPWPKPVAHTAVSADFRERKFTAAQSPVIPAGAPSPNPVIVPSSRPERSHPVIPAGASPPSSKPERPVIPAGAQRRAGIQRTPAAAPGLRFPPGPRGSRIKSGMTGSGPWPQRPHPVIPAERSGAPGSSGRLSQPRVSGFPQAPVDPGSSPG